MVFIIGGTEMTFRKVPRQNLIRIATNDTFYFIGRHETEGPFFMEEPDIPPDIQSTILEKVCIHFSLRSWVLNIKKQQKGKLPYYNSDL